MKFTIEARRTCRCGREVDAVRVHGAEDLPGLRFSRHFPTTTSLGPFCSRSLDEVK